MSTEASEAVTRANRPISQRMTAVMAEEMPTQQLQATAQPPTGSNPWSVVKAAGSGVTGSSVSGVKPANPIMAWASGQFPAMKIDPETQRLWEQRALLVGGIVLGLIFIIAIIIAIAG